MKLLGHQIKLEHVIAGVLGSIALVALLFGIYMKYMGVRSAKDVLRIFSPSPVMTATER